MSPHVATVLYGALVAALFALVRDRKAKVSAAIWIPLVWVWLASSRSVAGWLAVMGLAALPTEDVYVDGSPQGRLVQIVLISAALIVLVRRRTLGASLRSNPFLVAFFAYAALSATWSDYGDITLRRWFRAVGDPVMVLVVLTEADPGAAVKRLLVTAGFLLIPHSLLLIKYYPDIGRTYNRWTWSMMVTGVTTHKNTLGIICQIYGIAFCWGFLTAWYAPPGRERHRRLVAYGVALGMIAWLFWTAGSVTSQACFMLACLFLLLTKAGTQPQERRLVQALSIVLIAVPSAVLFLGVGSSSLEALGRNATLTGRTEIWHRVLNLSGNPLVGSGFESFWLGTRLETLQDWYAGLNSTHNGYLEIFVTLGWIGVVALVGLIVRGHRTILDLQERDPRLGALAMAYFIAVSVESYTEAAFRATSLTWIVFLLVTTRQAGAEAVAERGIVRVGRRKASVKLRPARAATVALLPRKAGAGLRKRGQQGVGRLARTGEEARR